MGLKRLVASSPTRAAEYYSDGNSLSDYAESTDSCRSGLSGSDVGQVVRPGLVAGVNERSVQTDGAVLVVQAPQRGAELGVADLWHAEGILEIGERVGLDEPQFTGLLGNPHSKLGTTGHVFLLVVMCEPSLGCGVALTGWWVRVLPIYL